MIDEARGFKSSTSPVTASTGTELAFAPGETGFHGFDPWERS
jgi:hypothetical protein